MRRIIYILFVFLFAGCATAELTDGGRKVRFVTTTPHNCEYLGEVSGDFRDSKSGGMVRDVEGFAEVDLKNRAAEVGADTVEIMSRGRQATGEAYRCGRRPTP